MFSSRDLRAKPGVPIDENRFRCVETDVVLRRVHCYKCDLTAIYKFRVKQIRRNPELSADWHPSPVLPREEPEPTLLEEEEMDVEFRYNFVPEVHEEETAEPAEVTTSPDLPSDDLLPPDLRSDDEEQSEVANSADDSTPIEITEFDRDVWRTIPRFAEIPETVRCKRCGEVLGLCTECIF